MVVLISAGWENHRYVCVLGVDFSHWLICLILPSRVRFALENYE